MTTVDELRHRAKNLANAYDNLAEFKWTPARQVPARKMRPVFGPRSPEPDNDWALTIEHELMRETTDERIPGGLRTIACDALGYTTANRAYLDETRPAMLCAYIYRHAAAIVDQFPAADDLAELLAEQLDYLTRQLGQRYGEAAPTTMSADTMATGYGTAADLAPLVTAATGRPTTREDIRYWGRSGRLTTYTQPDGTTQYRLDEAVAAAREYVDRRKGPAWA